MNCSDTRQRLHDAVERGAPLDAELAAHLLTCADCRDAYEDLQLAGLLRAAEPVPGARDGFVDEVIAGAIRSGIYRKQRIFAMAASVAAVAFAALAFSLLNGRAQPHGPVVTLAAHQGKTVRVIIESPTSEAAATLTIQLGDNLRLAGYPNERHIEWRTSLSEGKNLLALPLVLTDDADSQFEVTLLHGSMQNSVHVRVRPESVRSNLPTKA